MFVKKNIHAAILASLAFGLVACQEQKKEKLSPEVFREYTEPSEVLSPTVKDLIAESKNTGEEYRKLEPVLDEDFKKNMWEMENLLDQSNAKLVNPDITHNSENDANIISNDNETAISDKNSGLTELDAVEQAIQAAAPALEDNTEN